jgi:GNAT superfamily N-acetyltransferase
MRYRPIAGRDAAGLICIRARVRGVVRSAAELSRAGVTEQILVGWLGASHGGFVGVLAGELIGFCLAQNVSGQILGLAVSPLCERQRVGGVLLRRTELWLWTHGHRSIFVELSPEFANLAPFYQRYGWHTVSGSDEKTRLEKSRPNCSVSIR